MPLVLIILLTALTQGALKLVVIEGEGAVNIIQQKTALAPIVEVRDRNDVPVAGASVVFLINGSGASFANGAQSITVVTNAAGRATAAGLNPSAAGALKISATATHQGQTASVTISQTNALTSGTGAASKATRAGSSTGKIIGIVGGIGAAGAGAAVALGKSDSSSSGESISSQQTTTISSTSGNTAATTPTTTTTTTPTPTRSNTAPVITAATASPSVGLAGVTPVTFDVQATDAENDSLTYLWEFPDGSTSDQRAFSRVFQVGGVHNSRVTVRDGTTSISREFSFELKTVNGSWDDPRNPTRVFTFSQNGPTVTGTMTWSTLHGLNCPLTGTLSPSGPRLTLHMPACSAPVIFNGQQIAVATYERQITLDLDAAMSSFSGAEDVNFTNVSMSGVVQNVHFSTALDLRKR